MKAAKMKSEKGTISERYKALSSNVEKQLQEMETRPLWDNATLKREVVEEAYRLYEDMVSHLNGNDVLCGLAQVVARSLDIISGSERATRHARKGVQAIITQLVAALGLHDFVLK